MLMLLLAVGCRVFVGAIEYPEYLAGKNRRAHQPPPTLLIDPEQPTSRP